MTTQKTAAQLPDGKPAADKAPDIASASVPETLAALAVKAEAGLTRAEVEARRKEHGYNEVIAEKSHPVRKFLGKFWGISAWMLELIMVLSAVLGKFADLAVVGALLVIPARELLPGDIIRLRAGDIIPADVKLLSGTLSIDQSALTGESKDANKASGEVLSSGAVVRRGEGNGVVILTGANTFFGRTTELVQNAHPKLHIEAVVSNVVRWLFVIVGALLGLVIVLSLSLLWAGWVHFGLATNDSALYTFSFLTLLYMAAFSIVSARERRWFWMTMPSKTLIAALTADVLTGTVLTFVGLLGLMPLPWWQTLAIFVYAMVSCLVINDILKVILIKWRVPMAIAVARP